MEREAAASRRAQFTVQRDARAASERARARLSVPRRDFTFRGRVSALVFSRSIEIQAGFYCPLPGPRSYGSNLLYGFASLLSSERLAHSAAPPRSRRGLALRSAAVVAPKYRRWKTPDRRYSSGGIAMDDERASGCGS